MTRESKIALYIGAAVVGGVTIYLIATNSGATPPPAKISPVIPPPSTPTPTSTPVSSFAPETSTPPPQTPASKFPPSWNQFTSVIAGHRYLIQLHTAAPFDWSKVNVNAIPGSFSNLRAGTPSQTYYSYTLDAHVSHQVQNVMFLLGLTAYIDISVFDLGVAT